MAKRTRPVLSVVQFLSGAGGPFQDVCGVVASFLDPLSLHTLRRVSRHWLRLVDSLGLAKQPALILTQRCHPCASQCVYHHCIAHPYGCWRNRGASVRTPYVLCDAPGTPSAFDTRLVPGQFSVFWSTAGFLEVRLREPITIEWCKGQPSASEFSVHPRGGTVVYNTSWEGDPAGRFRLGTALLAVKLVY